MNAAALTLAVVGHTNTGKTSLLRTLTRDAAFGQVSNSPGTTRHVEGARLTVDDEALVELFDTPGLEDSMALLDFMDQLRQPGERIDGRGGIRRRDALNKRLACCVSCSPVMPVYTWWMHAILC